MSNREEALELGKIELESISDSYDSVLAKLRADRDKHRHMPPSLSVFFNSIKGDAVRNNADVRHMLLVAFMAGLEESAKGKKYEDYLRCPC